MKWKSGQKSDAECVQYLNFIPTRNAKQCEYCLAMQHDTPCWLKGPNGTGTLCNKCGTRWVNGKLKTSDIVERGKLRESEMKVERNELNGEKKEGESSLHSTRTNSSVHCSGKTESEDGNVEDDYVQNQQGKEIEEEKKYTVEEMKERSILSVKEKVFSSLENTESEKQQQHQQSVIVSTALKNPVLNSVDELWKCEYEHALRLYNVEELSIQQSAKVIVKLSRQLNKHVSFDHALLIITQNDLNSSGCIDLYEFYSVVQALHLL